MFVATGHDHVHESASSTVALLEPFHHFKLHEILSATQNFDESLVIGSVGFGKVYKGDIVIGSSSVIAAIKRLDSTSKQGSSEFWAEVEILSNLRHSHLVSLIGYCNHEKEMILIYEYMPSGTLYEHLHKLGTPLSWLRRLKISLGAARGLDYLHTGTGIEFGITHRDVKSSNILLTNSWAAKISDFGLSQLVPKDKHVSTLVKGSFGYLDPYYVATGKLSSESDVYAFGVVLLEVLIRKSAVDRSFDCGIVAWAKDSIKKGRLKHIIDSDIRDDISRKCLKWYVRITERCLEYHPKDRPAMAEVLCTLESIMTLQEKTSKLLKIPGWNLDLLMMRMQHPQQFSHQNSQVTRQNLIQFLHRKKIHDTNSDLITNSFGSITVFHYLELQNAIGDDHVLPNGKADFTMYKGMLPDKRVVAITNHNISAGVEHLEQFIYEVVILEQLNHDNVVQLLGFSFRSDEVAYLVHEYVSNGTLHDHIHNEISSSTVRLSWDTRLRIAHESASALAYLHTYPTMSIIHTNVKSANILLDENYTAKLSDFGASSLILLGQDEFTTQLQGTLGYIDPEYIHTCQLTDKRDVYSFGVVLAELLTSRKAINTERDEYRHLATYFMEANRQNRLSEIVDPLVLEEATDEQLGRACDLVCRCLEPLGGNRPSMKEVTLELESLRKLGKHRVFVQEATESGSFTIESEQVDPYDIYFPAYSD